MRKLYTAFGLGTLMLLVAFTNFAEKKDLLFSALDGRVNAHEKARAKLVKDFDAKQLEVYDGLHSDMKFERDQAKIAIADWLDARSKTGNPAADSLAADLMDQMIKLNNGK